jgi:hypothetical protein
LESIAHFVGRSNEKIAPVIVLPEAKQEVKKKKKARGTTKKKKHKHKKFKVAPDKEGDIEVSPTVDQEAVKDATELTLSQKQPIPTAKPRKGKRRRSVTRD